MCSVFIEMASEIDKVQALAKLKDVMSSYRVAAKVDNTLLDRVFTWAFNAPAFCTMAS